MHFSYSYGIHSKPRSGIKWRCTQRNPLCSAMVTQQGDDFTQLNDNHTHPPTMGKSTKVKAIRAVKEQAKENLYKSAYTIAETVTLG